MFDRLRGLFGGGEDEPEPQVPDGYTGPTFYVRRADGSRVSDSVAMARWNIRHKDALYVTLAQENYSIRRRLIELTEKEAASTLRFITKRVKVRDTTKPPSEHCHSCGAPLKWGEQDVQTTCAYCGTQVFAPYMEERRRFPAPSQPMPR